MVLADCFAESEVESGALPWLEAIGWLFAHGAGTAPDQLLAERRDYSEVVPSQSLPDALLPN